MGLRLIKQLALLSVELILRLAQIAAESMLR